MLDLTVGGRQPAMSFTSSNGQRQNMVAGTCSRTTGWLPGHQREVTRPQPMPAEGQVKSAQQGLMRQDTARRPPQMGSQRRRLGTANSPNKVRQHVSLPGLVIMSIAELPGHMHANGAGCMALATPLQQPP